MKAGVELTLTKQTWKESGEISFKESISSSLGVEPDDVKILSVSEVAIRRRLRELDGLARLEVEFEVDVTSIAEEGSDNAVVVTEVSKVIRSSRLVRDIKAATGISSLTLEVTEEPVGLEVEKHIKDSEDANTHEQGGGWKQTLSCKPVDGMCIALYGTVALFILSMFCCFLTCCVKAFSKTNRAARSARTHVKLAKKRSTKKEFELPSTFGGLRDSEFSNSDTFGGENPMREGGTTRPAKPPPGRRKRGPSAWERFLDEGSGHDYWVNTETGESNWDPPVGWKGD